jgi:cytosine deaminase
MYDWVLRGGRLPGREAIHDVAIAGDKIAAVAPRIEGRGGREMDVAGRLLLPGFVNAHVAIAADGGDLEGRAAMALEGAVRQGTTTLRLTVDLDRSEPLMPLRVLARVRAQYAGRVAVQVAVRAPFSALTRDADVLAQLDKAARAGADALAIHMDVAAPAGDDLRTSLAALAATGLPVDVSVDTALPPGEIGLAALALTPLLHALPPELARRTRVVQPDALAAVHRDELTPVLARLAALGVTVVVCPFDALRRGGRTDVAAARRGIPRLAELLGAGVRVALGSGGAWRELPIALDPTALTWAAGYATYLGTPPALETLRAAVTTWAAESLGLPASEIRGGHRADLVVLEASSFAAAVVDHAEKHAVLVGGRLVHESSRRTERVAPAVAETGSSSLVIRGATLSRRRGAHDVVVVDGVIRSITPSAGAVPGATIDAAGRLLVPAFVDAHLHVDKTFVMDRVTFPGGILTVGEAIAAMASVKAAYTEDDLLRRGRLTFERALRHGTTAIRAQCDVDPVIGLMALEALVRLRREFASLLDVQIVAFPQEGLLRDPRTVELMRRAVRAGADVIGGGPLDDDYRAHIAQGFELACELGVPVDIHADLPIDRLRPLPEWEAPLIAAHARASGLAGRVAIGHFASSSALTAEQALVLAASLAEAGVHVAALPASEMYRQGLSDPVNSRRGVPRVRELLEAGVNVAFASNNVRDAFVTFGDADMLEQALLGALAAHLADFDTVLDMVTSRPATLMGLAHRNGVEVGKDADLVLLDARSAGEAIGAQVEKLYVIRRGGIVVRNERATGGGGPA